MHSPNNTFAAFILLAFLLGTLANGHSQTEAKVNIATLPLLIPNVGLEVPLGEKQSFQLDVLGSFWDEQPLLDDTCLLYTSPSPRDLSTSRMPSSA